MSQSISNAQDAAAEAVHTVKEDLKHAASKAKTAAKAGMHAGEERVREVVGVASERAAVMHTDLSQRVSERPLAYVGGAVAAGVALGILLARR